MMRPAHTVYLPVLICAFLWGSAFPAIKIVYGHWSELGITVNIYDLWLFAGIRFSIAGLALLLISKKPWQELQSTPKKWIALLAVSQTLLQYLLFYLGLSISSGSLSALMAATGSFWWMLLAPIILRKPWPNFRQWLILCLGAFGVVLAVYAPGAGAGDPLLGAACILFATFFGALGILVISKIQVTMGSRAATGYALLLGGIGLCIIAFPSWGNIVQLFDALVIFITLWLILISAMAFAIWNKLSTQYPVPLLASCRFLIPISGVSQSLFFLEESLGWGLLAGGILVIGSMLFASRKAPD